MLADARTGPGPDLIREVDTTSQVLLTGGTTGMAIIAIAAVVLLSRRERSWVPVSVLVVGGSLGAFVEPIYDSYLHLWFYVPDQWNMYQSFGIHQPVWVLPTWIWFYGGQGLYVARRIAQGADRRSVHRMAAIVFLVPTAFELIGINIGLYEYWGPQALSVAGLPLWVSATNAAVVIGIGVAVAKAAPLLPGARALALALTIPACSVAGWYGAGFLVVNVMNMEGPSQLALDAAGVLAIGLSVVLVALVSLAVPTTGEPARIARRTKLASTERGGEREVLLR